jgi:hypothetical protein
MIRVYKRDIMIFLRELELALGHASGDVVEIRNHRTLEQLQQRLRNAF